MAVMVMRVSDAAEDLATMAGARVLGSLTVPGRPDQVSRARAFIAATLDELTAAAGDLGDCPDTAVLLTSELVTNSVRHSDSRAAGGTVTIAVLEVPGGLRIEVADAGSPDSAPVVKGDTFASDGHGLFLVEAMAEHWGYLRDEAGTTVWFQLPVPRRPAGPACRGRVTSRA
jgi:anti-sigma regulatory factor (Ser/Thr protein kinase)